MKRIVLTLAILLSSLYQVGAQYDPSQKFDGVWKIEVEHVDLDYGDDTYVSYIEIKNGDIAILREGKTEYYKANSQFDVVEFNTTRNNLTFFWMNSGGVWTETQAFSMSLIEDGVMAVKCLRQVNNIKSEYESEEWGYFQEGYAYKLDN